jgi:hypothetical protein
MESQHLKNRSVFPLLYQLLVFQLLNCRLHRIDLLTTIRIVHAELQHHAFVQFTEFKQRKTLLAVDRIPSADELWRSIDQCVVLILIKGALKDAQVDWVNGLAETQVLREPVVEVAPAHFELCVCVCGLVGVSLHLELADLGATSVQFECDAQVRSAHDCCEWCLELSEGLGLIVNDVVQFKLEKLLFFKAVVDVYFGFKRWVEVVHYCFRVANMFPSIVTHLKNLDHCVDNSIID